MATPALNQEESQPQPYVLEGNRPRSHSWIFHGLLALCASGVCGYFLAVFTPLFFVAPYVDDVDSILWFLLKSKDASSAWDSLGLIVFQHNEHRIATTKLLALLILKTTGSMSFVISSTVAMILMVLLIPCVVVSVQGTPTLTRWQRAAAVALPFVCFAYQPAGFEGMLWSTVSCATAFCNLAAILAALLVFAADRRCFALGVCAALVAVYSQGNGLVILPVLLFLLLVRKEWTKAGMWAVASVGIAALYFHGYVPPPGHPRASESLPFVARNLEYVMIFMGLSMAAGSKVAATWWGVAFSTCTVALLLSGYAKRNPALFAVVLFIIGSMSVNALSRSEFGVDYTLTQRRYLLLASMLPAFLGACIVDATHRSMRSAWLVVAVSVGAAFFSYNSFQVYLPQAQELSDRTRSGLRDWARTGVGLAYPWPDRSDTIVGLSVRSKIYNPGQRNRDRAIARLKDVVLEMPK